MTVFRRVLKKTIYTSPEQADRPSAEVLKREAAVALIKGIMGKCKPRYFHKDAVIPRK